MESQTDTFIFSVLLKSGQYIIGESLKPGRTIASINSGLYPIADFHSIHSIHGIKEVTEERTLESLKAKMVKKYGTKNVLVFKE